MITEELDITQVHQNPEQPRQYFDEDKLKELADSIKQHGLIVPILVQPVDNGYQIVHGERRWRACQLAGLETVRAEVQETDKAYVLSVIENEQREDLSPIETAQAIAKLMKEQGLTQEQTARRISRSRTWVTQKLRLLKLPTDVQKMVSDNVLSEGHGRQLLKLDNSNDAKEVASKAKNGGWSVSQIETEVNSRITKEPKPTTANFEIVKRTWDKASPNERMKISEWIGQQDIYSVSRDTIPKSDYYTVKAGGNTLSGKDTQGVRNV